MASGAARTGGIPVDEQVAYAGTRYEGLYITEDGGATWRPERAPSSRLGQGSVPATASVRAILLSADGQQVYVATGQGVFRRRPSCNLGATGPMLPVPQQ
jgi:photosystem II stability/assembly factor-like uncharacterized protein